MTQLFEARTGKFMPLTDDELATLNEQQVIAYNDLKSSVEALADADAEAADAKAQLNADVAALSEVERNAPPPPTFHDEWKRMTATASVAVAETEPWPIEQVEEEVEPVLTVADAQRAVVVSQVRLRTATDRQRECRGLIGAVLQRWTVAIGSVVTAEENARQFIASSNEQRALRASGMLPPRRGRVMRSVIDSTAQAHNSGNGRNGGGNAFRRVVKDDNGQWVRPVSVHDRGRR